MRVIGICGVARAGKDSLCAILKTKFQNSQRFALADALKQDIDPFLWEKTGISAWTTSTEEKKLIRDMLVAYGKIKRLQSQGTYWTSKLETIIRNQSFNPIVTDIRYDIFPEDEVYWIKNKMNGILIHVERIDENGEVVAPPNADERENDPRLKKSADFHVVWPTINDLSRLQEYLPPALLKAIE